MILTAISASINPWQVHILAAHGGDCWCKCGICNQQLCEGNLCLPAILTEGPALAVADVRNQNRGNFAKEIDSFLTPEPGSIEKNPSYEEDQDYFYSSHEAKLPALILCSILECHEHKHLFNLRPQPKLSYLPTDLIQQLLESRGHQAKQIYDWLSNISNQPQNMDIMPFIYENPNSTSRSNMIGIRLTPGEDPLNQEGVEIGQRMLEDLVSRQAILVQNTATDGGDKVTQENELTFSDATHDTSSASIQVKPKEDESRPGMFKPEFSNHKNILPEKMAKLFTSIGQRNSAREQGKGFEDRF